MSPVERGVRDPVQVVTNDLLAEFDGTLSHETISTLALEEVRAFEDAEVREFVPILAWRRARSRAWAMSWRGEPVDLDRSHRDVMGASPPPENRSDAWSTSRQPAS